LVVSNNYLIFAKIAEQLGKFNQYYKDYTLPTLVSNAEFWLNTAKESLQSLITSLGLTGEILILEKLN
jgi:hypothetical protein